MGSLVLPNLLTLSKQNVKLETMLASRVLTSFMRDFAEKQFSEENLAFIQEERDFREKFQGRADEKALKAAALKIWETYINEESATSQICFTMDEYRAVESKIKSEEFHHEMFMSLLKNPITTIERDLFPRFRNSPEFKLMVDYIQNPKKEYLATVKMKKPTIIGTAGCPNLDDKDLAFTFDQVVNDYYLSTHFINYLAKKHCAENMKCLQRIKLYKVRHGCKEVSPCESRDRAFEIYFQFLNPGCDEEVSVESHVRHQIGHHLAKETPPSDLFEVLESTLLKLLKQQNWNDFKSSPEYKQLPQILREVANSGKGSQSGSAACNIQ